MKKTIAIILCVCFFSLTITACGNDMRMNGTVYKTQGFFTQDQKDPCVKYNVIVGNVVWTVILSESLLFPIYFLGFSIWEPVGWKDTPTCRKRLLGKTASRKVVKSTKHVAEK